MQEACLAGKNLLVLCLLRFFIYLFLVQDDMLASLERENLAMTCLLRFFFLQCRRQLADVEGENLAMTWLFRCLTFCASCAKVSWHI
jgi:hypothetical protein